MQQSVSTDDFFQKDANPNHLEFKVMRHARPMFSAKLTHYPVDELYSGGTTTITSAGPSSSTVLGDQMREREMCAYQPIHESLAAQSSFAITGMAQVSCLPESFGVVYLGETFSAIVSLCNVNANQRFFNVSCRIELLTASNRFVLVDSSTTPVEALAQSQNLDFSLQHEIKELGLYTLICAAAYSTEDEKKFFRKSYKFQVVNPISVKTKVNSSAPDGSVFLEVHVKNEISLPIYLEKLKIDPAELFIVEDLNKINFTPAAPSNQLGCQVNFQINQSSPYHPWLQFNPQDTRQYLFRFIPKSNPCLMSKKDVSTLGKIDIAWRHSFGELGMLQTNQLTRKSPIFPDFAIIPLKVPENILLEEPFTAKVRLFNNTDRSFAKLFLSPIRSSSTSSKYYSVLMCDELPLTLDYVKSKSFMDFDLKLLPLSPGIHHVAGLNIMESPSKTLFSLENVFEVFILDSTIN